MEVPMGINVALDMRPPHPTRAPFAIEAFTIRAEARAYLVAAGEMSRHDAVDGLQESAVDTGLVDQLGQDAVQAHGGGLRGARRPCRYSGTLNPA
jgi:hypothetical protein